MGEERRAVSLDSLAEQVACTVRAFHDFRRNEFVPLENKVTRLSTNTSEVLDIVKFLKMGFKVTCWIAGTAASTAVFGRTMGWW